MTNLDSFLVFKIVRAAHEFEYPTIFESNKDSILKIDGEDIRHDIDLLTTFWKNKDYIKFGEEIRKVAELIYKGFSRNEE